MSVILGVKRKDYIIIASDKRKTNENGSFSDNGKFFEVNKQLAFTGAGPASFVEGIITKLKESLNKDTMRTDDILEIAKEYYNITRFCSELKKKMDKNFVDNSNACCCFVAGLNKSNISKLIFAHDVNHSGNLNFSEFPEMIVGPDMPNDNSFDILKKNISIYPLNFSEYTIRDISGKSNLVSSTGDKWTFDLNKKEGKTESF